jgi:type VI secretion system protein ImpG
MEDGIMSTDKLKEYYQKELANLREESKKFAEKYTDMAFQLQSGAQDNDPDVERILEGLAYLTANLQMKIDSDLPVLVNKLAELVYPQVMRVFPSMAIFEFTAKSSLKSAVKINKGSSITSQKINDHRCKYMTCEDVVILPLEIKDVSYSKIDSQNSIIITIDSIGVDLAKNLPNEIEFYINQADNKTDLLYLMRDFVNNVEFNIGGKKHTVAGKKAVKIKTQYKSDSIETDFKSGYHLLQRYLCFPESFMMFKVFGASCIKLDTEETSMKIIFHLDNSFTNMMNLEPQSLNKDSFRINCVAGINLYEDSAEPMDIKNVRVRSEVLPKREFQTIYKISKVSKVSISGSEEYLNWIEKQKDPTLKNNGFYETVKIFEKNDNDRNSIKRGSRIFLEIGSDTESNNNSNKVTIVVDLLCTDGKLCSKLGTGMINIAGEGIPDRTMKVKNITKPSVESDPSLESDVLWRFICQYNFSISTRLTASQLKGLLLLYVPAEKRYSNNIEMQRIESIEKLDIQRQKRLRYGYLEQGICIKLKLHDDYISDKGTGDVILFGEILKQFLEVFRTLNYYLRLELTSDRRGQIGFWE